MQGHLSAEKPIVAQQSVIGVLSLLVALASALILVVELSLQGSRALFYSGVLLSIVSVVCGHIGRSEINAQNATHGGGLTTMALVLGYLAMFGYAGTVALVFAHIL